MCFVFPILVWCSSWDSSPTASIASVDGNDTIIWSAADKSWNFAASWKTLAWKTKDGTEEIFTIKTENHGDNITMLDKKSGLNVLVSKSLCKDDAWTAYEYQVHLLKEWTTHRWCAMIQ